MPFLLLLLLKKKNHIPTVTFQPKSFVCFSKSAAVQQVFTTVEHAAFAGDPMVHIKTLRLYLQCLHFKVSVMSCKKFPSPPHMILTNMPSPPVSVDDIAA